MRRLLVAVAALLFLALPAHAVPWPPGATAIYYSSDFYCSLNGVSCGGPYWPQALYTGGGQMGDCCIGQSGGSQWFGGDTITNNVAEAGNGYFSDSSKGGPGLVSANGEYVATIINGNLALFYTAGQLGVTSTPYPTWNLIWDSGTSDGGPNANSGTYALVINGYFAMYTQQSNPIANNVYIWGPPVGGGAKLVLQNSGDMQLLDPNGVVLWHTNTAGMQ